MKSKNTYKSSILTSAKSVDIVVYIEDFITKSIIDNTFSYASVFMGVMKKNLLDKQNLFGAEMEIKTVVIGPEKQMEIKFYFSNVVLYIRTLFFKDPDALFTHNTDLVYITDLNGVIKQDILEYINRYKPKNQCNYGGCWS